MTKIMIRPLFSLAILTVLLPISLSANAQTCTSLAVVKGDGTSVTKQVSAPNLGTIPRIPVGYRGNWDTDFVVPNNATFTEYIATIQSLSNDPGIFKIKMYLKYPDDTADQVFEGDIPLDQNQSQQISGTPRSDSQPYQVNVNVGGVKVLGYSYTLSVQGCQ
ncbi:MAG: hypothetical protein RSE13_25780 [Planktothrix sp. GU0601_MAG3]|nr:MAG: hypothetical protein RSE13_25780 [Planktothrix sp. GU0601_MAG3]